MLDAVCSEGGPEVRPVLYSLEIQHVGTLHTLASKIYRPQDNNFVSEGTSAMRQRRQRKAKAAHGRASSRHRYEKLFFHEEK